VYILAAIVAFFNPRVVGLLSLAVASAIWLLALVMAKSIRGRSNRRAIIVWVWLGGVVAFTVIGYAGVRWGEGSGAETAHQKERGIAQTAGTPIGPPAPLASQTKTFAESPVSPQTPTATDTMPNSILPEQMHVPRPALQKDTHKAIAENEPAQPTPLPIKRITILSQNDVNPKEGDPPYATEVTLVTTVDVRPTWLALTCDAPIADTYCYVNLGTPMVTLSGCGRAYSPDKKTIWLHFQEPTFSPGTPLIVTLKGNVRIRAESVAEERPPTGVVEVRSSGICIRRRPVSLDAP